MNIINPIPSTLIEQELTPEKFLRPTNKGGNLLYIIDANNSPNTMLEIGRLREIAFRAAGGGTGKPMDIDEFDTMDTPCQQLIVWNPDAHEIIGGYRFIAGSDIKLKSCGQPQIATSHLFHFSQQFIEQYMPYTIELGRSFVTVEYQSSRAGAKALYALDNLWDGLGALTVAIPNTKYLFGKVTMYPSYHTECRDMILHLLSKHFPDHDQLVTPITPLPTDPNLDKLQTTFCNDTFIDDYRILNKEVRALGFNIPPLVNAYMHLSPTMRTFGTAINDEFGDVEETGIFITVDEIFDEKKNRHIDTYTPSPQQWP